MKTSFKLYRRLLNLLFLQWYGLSSSDFEISDQEILNNIKSGIKPMGAVFAYAEKYDLEVIN
jgi:hypothetical protein